MSSPADSSAVGLQTPSLLWAMTAFKNMEWHDLIYFLGRLILPTVWKMDWLYWQRKHIGGCCKHLGEMMGTGAKTLAEMKKGLNLRDLNHSWPEQEKGWEEWRLIFSSLEEWVVNNGWYLETICWMNEWINYRTKSRWDGERKGNSILDEYIWSQYKKFWSSVCEENSCRFGDTDLELA